jgi:hypothetical protein
VRDAASCTSLADTRIEYAQYTVLLHFDNFFKYIEEREEAGFARLVGCPSCISSCHPSVESFCSNLREVQATQVLRVLTHIQQVME